MTGVASLINLPSVSPLHNSIRNSFRYYVLRIYNCLCTVGVGVLFPPFCALFEESKPKLLLDVNTPSLPLCSLLELIKCFPSVLCPSPHLTGPQQPHEMRGDHAHLNRTTVPIVRPLLRLLK